MFVIKSDLVIVQVSEVFIQFSSVQSLSRVRICDPMNCSTPGLPVGLKLNIHKTKIMASGPITSFQIDGK